MRHKEAAGFELFPKSFLPTNAELSSEVWLQLSGDKESSTRRTRAGTPVKFFCLLSMGRLDSVLDS